MGTITEPAWKVLQHAFTGMELKVQKNHVYISVKVLSLWEKVYIK